jgi:hypothetical protein
MPKRSELTVEQEQDDERSSRTCFCDVDIAENVQGGERERNSCRDAKELAAAYGHKVDSIPAGSSFAKRLIGQKADWLKPLR